MIACNSCKGTNIVERIWVRVNEETCQKGKNGNYETYYPIDWRMHDKSCSDEFWCKDCNDDTIIFDNEEVISGTE